MTRIVAVSNFPKWFRDEYLTSLSQIERNDALRLHWNNYHLDGTEMQALVDMETGFDVTTLGNRDFISNPTVKTRLGEIGIIRVRPDKLPTESNRIQKVDMHGEKFKFQWFEQYGIISLDGACISRTVQMVYDASRNCFLPRSILILPKELMQGWNTTPPSMNVIVGGGCVYRGFCRECDVPEEFSGDDLGIKKAFLATGFRY